MDFYYTVFLALLAYFIGSISFSYILTKKLTGKDIRNIDIKNAGALNVILNVNKKLGVIVGILDLTKTLLIVVLGEAIGLELFWIIVAASFGVVGHCFPIYHRFYGGKGAASVIGILIYYIPLQLIISLFPAALIAYLIQRLGTTPLFMFLFTPVLTYLFDKPISLVWAVIYLVLLTGIINAIILLIKRDHQLIS